ncbi:hypothetical protein [Streptomyces pseudovenezuelae]|uniref:hypothetical protein n=1 Tax=Streptomyces pseudovenezuelae TaxID=67350 RepID=UPI0036ED4692
MFGSIRAVADLVDGWNRWATTVDELLTDCAEHRIHAHLAGTAAAFYRPPTAVGASKSHVNHHRHPRSRRMTTLPTVRAGRRGRP